MTKKTALSPRHHVKRRGDFPIFSIVWLRGCWRHRGVNRCYFWCCQIFSGIRKAAKNRKTNIWHQNVNDTAEFLAHANISAKSKPFLLKSWKTGIKKLEVKSHCLYNIYKECLVWWVGALLPTVGSTAYTLNHFTQQAYLHSLWQLGYRAVHQTIRAFHELLIQHIIAELFYGTSGLKKQLRQQLINYSYE